MDMSDAPSRRTTRAPRLVLLLILGALTAFAPMAVDMYLPAFPALARDLGGNPGGAQATLATFFIGFAVGQAFYGPLSDRFGRKAPLYFGLTVFILASAACTFVPTLEWLSAIRLVQALGAAAGVVISRAMVRDLFTNDEAPAVYSALMLVMGAAPILAPTLGGWVLALAGWKAIFWCLGAFGLASLLAVHFALPESHPGSPGAPLALGPVLRGYGALMVDRRYMGLALTGGVSMAGMFAYIAGSPFVFIELNRVPAEYYGLLFGTNAGGFILLSQVNGRFAHRLGPERLMRWAGLVQAGAGLVLLASAWSGAGGFLGILLPLFVYIACLGFIMPNAAALAMAPHGQRAGAASALLGTLQFTIAALASSLVGLLHDGTALPMTAIIALCGLTAPVLYRSLIRPTPFARGAR